MLRYLNHFAEFAREQNSRWHERANATAIEYGLIAALIALAVMAGLSGLSGGGK